jgi:hypothetical protein
VHNGTRKRLFLHNGWRLQRRFPNHTRAAAVGCCGEKGPGGFSKVKDTDSKMVGAIRAKKYDLQDEKKHDSRANPKEFHGAQCEQVSADLGENVHARCHG